VKGLPYVEEIQLGREFDKPHGGLELSGKRVTFVVARGVKERNLLDPFLDLLSQL
jgi:hypothetical protein